MVFGFSDGQVEEVLGWGAEVEKTCAPRRLCYSCMINSGRSLENIVVFGQKAHLRHGLRSDSVGWDG